MEANKRILQRISIDTIIMMCVGIPIIILFFYGKPYKRGFFCDDESLKHPYKKSTIRSWMLYVIGVLLPIFVIFINEIVQHYRNQKISNGNAITHQYVFLNCKLPNWLAEFYKYAGIFGFGVAVCQLTTDIAKYSIGRLRPHFFAVCQPILHDNTTCEDSKNMGKYITDFHCRGVGFSEHALKDVRLSFPSGHSSFGFFTMIFLVMYLQSRMSCNGSKLLLHFFQFICLMMAWYTALSRIADYKHHWSDVLVGSLLGSFSAIIVDKCISKKWFTWSSIPSVDDLRRLD